MGEKEKGRTISQLIRQEELADIDVNSKEIKEWIEATLGEKLPKPGLRESLMDGVILCKLINVLKTSSVKRFHSRPRMMAMKIENIGFFLAACTSRFGLPQAMLFAPMDLHEEKDDPAIMRKVLGVLLHLKGENGDVPQRTPEDSEPTETEQSNPYSSYSEEAASEPYFSTYTDPEVDHEQVSAEPEIEETKYVSEPESSSNYEASDLKKYDIRAGETTDQIDSEWYLEGKPATDYIAAEGEIFSIILSTINKELSIESKQKLVEILKNQISGIQQKAMKASNEELRALAHEMGLGKTLNDVPQKSREWNLEFILKFGRCQ